MAIGKESDLNKKYSSLIIFKEQRITVEPLQSYSIEIKFQKMAIMRYKENILMGD